MHFGGIIVPPGYTDPIKFADGKPYGVSHITGPDNLTQVAEPTTAALTHLAHRVVAIAALLPHSRAARPDESSDARTCLHEILSPC
jgi:NAD(P)H dehydrogenase (quinone)